jgi:hypothetical protein
LPFIGIAASQAAFFDIIAISAANDTAAAIEVCLPEESTECAHRHLGDDGRKYARLIACKIDLNVID